jgi:hypothetical protein
MAAMLAAGFASADETQTSKTQMKREAGSDGSKTSVETKSTRDPDGAMNSTTDTSKAERSYKAKKDGGSEETLERKNERDAPGSKGDAKSQMKEKIERDAQGNVTKHEMERK